MACPERERLESALGEMLNQRDYLNKLSRDDPRFGQLKQEIERLSIKVDQAQGNLHAVNRFHRFRSRFWGANNSGTEIVSQPRRAGFGLACRNISPGCCRR